MSQEVCLYERPSGVLDEDILLAVLYHVHVRFRDDDLIEAMGEAARQCGGMFSVFEKRTSDGGNQRVSGFLQTADLCNVINRQGVSEWFRCSSLLLGLYGRAKVMLFTPKQQLVFVKLAGRVVELASRPRPS